jgi:hypothetical protein
MRSIGVIGGQEVGSQTGSSPRQVAGETQSACVVTVQVSSSAQQTPSGGCGHGFGVHITHSERQSDDEQDSCVVTVQAPVAAQQAPCGGGHEVGSQTKTPVVQVPSAQSLA